jgi:hypothetical protein
MGGIILAWALGEGIIVWRAVAQEKRPPVPGNLLAATALFALCAAVGEYQPARGVATLFAFGVDIAVLMQVLPGGGNSTSAPANASPKITGAAPTGVTPT